MTSHQNVTPLQTPSLVCGARQRHCWECMRRRLVCDFTRPTCTRCSTSGLDCPGYGRVKPPRLRWLPPGRVLSSTRRPNGRSPRKEESQRNEESTRAEVGGELVPLFAEPRISCPDIRPEYYVLVEAAEYFNTCIYHSLAHVQALGPCPQLYFLSPDLIQLGFAYPDHVRIFLVCMVLTHRINRVQDSSQRSALTRKYYWYRGMIIRSLVHDINLESRWGGDTLLAGIISFLLADVQQGVSSNWRCHLDAIHRLVVLRGGIFSLARLEHLSQLLHCFVFLAIIGNTTCPACDLNMTTPTMAEVDFILKKNSSVTIPFQLLPPPLLVEIVNINRLRAQATNCAGTRSLLQEAVEVLNRIKRFPSARWAQLKPSLQRDWALVGDVYRSAVLLYGISSLRSVAVLDQSPSLDALWATHAQSLQRLLYSALSSSRIKNNMLWPLVVFGVVSSAGCGSAARNLVATKLVEMSQQSGSFAPLLAKNILERFWRSDNTHWDACFDRPHIFVTILSLDLKHACLQPDHDIKQETGQRQVVLQAAGSQRELG